MDKKCSFPFSLFQRDSQMGIFILSRIVLTLKVLFEFVIWLPFFMYRVQLIEYSKIFKPNLGHVLNPKSSAMVENFQSAYNIAVMFSIKIEGSLTLKRITRLFEANVLEARLENKMRYPQLKQYPVNFGGHWFLKTDPDFNIKNHIHEWKESNSNSISKLHQEILNRPWNKNKSLWELFLVDIEDNQSCHLFLRMHHTLSDGKSMIKLMVEGLGQKQQKVARANYPEKWFGDKFLLPLHYMQMIFDGMNNIQKIKEHPWNITKHARRDIPPTTFVSLTPPISMSKLKTIAKQNTAYPSSVIMSIISGAVSKLYGNSFKNEALNFLYVVPKPNHPPTLTNHSLVGGIELSMEDISPTLRLRMCNDVHKKLKDSSIPKCISMSVNQSGSWPERIRNSGVLREKADFVVAITNMAADDEGFHVDGLSCSNIASSIGLRYGSLGVTFMTVGYKETLQVTVMGSRLIMSEEDVNALSQEVKQEFSRLCVENGL